MITDQCLLVRDLSTSGDGTASGVARLKKTCGIRENPVRVVGWVVVWRGACHLSWWLLLKTYFSGKAYVGPSVELDLCCQVANNKTNSECRLSRDVTYLRVVSIQLPNRSAFNTFLHVNSTTYFGIRSQNSAPENRAVWKNWKTVKHKICNAATCNMQQATCNKTYHNCNKTCNAATMWAASRAWCLSISWCENININKDGWRRVYIHCLNFYSMLDSTYGLYVCRVWTPASLV